MTLSLFIAVIAIVVVNAAFDHSSDKRITETFDSWAIKHNKVYSTQEEKDLRLTNFKSSVSRIAALNARTAERGVGATYGLNKFSDLSTEEFASKILMTPFNPTETSIKKERMLEATTVAPDTFDWRSQGLVTAVKDQAQCGSCWAFSVTENVESVWMKAKGLTNVTMIPLAPQQIVDCDKSDAGCDGGNPETAYEYIQSAGGLDSEKSYPYTAVDGTCRFKKDNVVTTISNWKYATTSYDETTLKNNLVSWAAISICLDARYWQDYKSGVMTAYECDWVVQLDHCVQAVGFDTTATTPYWIVRNSWGADWGEKGYILLEYGGNTCGLTEQASSAVV